LALLGENLKEDPYSRRLSVSAWNVGALKKMKLPPCHAFFSFTSQMESFLVSFISEVQMFSWGFPLMLQVMRF
jgi:thymidylate synthase